MTGIQKPPIYPIALIQTGILIIVCLVLWFMDVVAAYSAFWGGLVFIVPNLYFAVCAFRHQGARASALIARSFFKGEVGKYVLTLVGFALLFNSIKPINAVVVFVSYGAMIILQWLMAAYVIKKRI